MTKENIVIGCIALLALVVAGVGLIPSESNLGGVLHNQKESFTQGAWFGNSRQLEIQNDGDISTEGDFTVTGRDVIFTSSNSATSSVTVGCVTTYATSTQTPITFVFGTSFGTTTLPGNAVSNGLVAWSYGSCP